ncbi:MAG TPA: YciI family protein [Solirubrobacteraceae bacterium]|nr:YciI family protein [Solirubrobacteraceae bacterium]
MQYMLLIYGDESQRTEPSTPEEAQAQLQPWIDYGQWLTDEGLMKAGDALQPTPTATTVTAANGGEPVVSDGPFAETKEQLGGYYVIDAPDLDRAIEAAARCPGAQWGKIEVRPVMVFD